MNGKGSKRRPKSVDDSTFEKNWNLAFSKAISDFKVVENIIFVTDRNRNKYQIQKEQIPALSNLSDKQLADFTMSESGSWVHWDHGDVDLSLDDFRYAVDEDYQRDVDKSNQMFAQDYGNAIRKLRESKSITYKDILEKTNLSEKEVRLLELGEMYPNSSVLEKLANAHGMGLNEYLNAVMSFDK